MGQLHGWCASYEGRNPFSSSLLPFYLLSILLTWSHYGHMNISWRLSLQNLCAPYFWLLVICETEAYSADALKVKSHRMKAWAEDVKMSYNCYSMWKTSWCELLRNTEGQISGLQIIDAYWKEMLWPWTQLHRGGKTNSSILCLLNTLHLFSCCPVTDCPNWDCNKTLSTGGGKRDH